MILLKSIWINKHQIPHMMELLQQMVLERIFRKISTMTSFVFSFQAPEWIFIGKLTYGVKRCLQVFYAFWILWCKFAIHAFDAWKFHIQFVLYCYIMVLHVSISSVVWLLRLLLLNMIPSLILTALAFPFRRQGNFVRSYMASWFGSSSKHEFCNSSNWV